MNHLNYWVWVDPRIADVTVEKMRTYMLNHGWTLCPHPNPNVLVFGGQYADGGEEFNYVLPASEQARDFKMLLEDLVTAVAALENRFAGYLLDDILAAEPANGALSASVPAGTESAPARKS